MSFIEYMVSHTEQYGFGSVFGVGRSFLWWVVQILTTVCASMEYLYNNIFSLFKMVYSTEVVNFIQGWIGFLWIPIAISMLVLGYNLMFADDAVDTHQRMKRFLVNVFLLMFVLFGLPFLFMGNTSTSRAFTDSSVSGNNSPNLSNSTNVGISGIMSSQHNKQGTLIAINDELGGVKQDSQTATIIADNIIDLKDLYQQVCNQDDYVASSTWSNSLSSGGKYTKNAYVGNNAKAIIGIDINELITSTEIGGFSNDKSVSALAKNGYDIITSANDYSGNKVDYSEDLKNGTKPEADIGEGTKGSDYLFGCKHNTYLQVDTDKNGSTNYVMINNDDKTTPDLDWATIFSAYNYRYYVEWGFIIISLITSALVLLLSSYKIARIIYEITVSQLIAVFTAGADLTNGQKTREVLKSIAGLVVSLLFATILVEFFFIMQDFIRNRLTGTGEYFKWLQCAATLFVGLATIKGPAILERIFGVNGGLRDEYGAMSQVARAAGSVKRTAVHTGMVAGGLAIGAAKLGGRGVSYARGKIDAAAEASKPSRYASAGENGKKSIHGGNKTVNDGDKRQFTAMGETFKEQQDSLRNKIAKGKTAERQKAIADNVAEKYEGNILNDAFAQTVNGKDDNAALVGAYEASGFSHKDAENYANKAIADGTFEKKKETFDNSVVAKGDEMYSANPSAFESQADAYKAAAEEHYKAMGVTPSGEALDDYARSLSAQEHQSDIRKEAIRYQNSEEGKGCSDAEAVKYAISNSDSNLVRKGSAAGYYNKYYSSEGYTKVVNDVLACGSLKEGVKYARSGNNVQREQFRSNTRAGSLNTGGVVENVFMGYKSGREVKTTYQAGFENRRNKAQQKKKK